MHTWCKEIDLKQYNPRNDIEIHYFKRRMNRYDAHIIIVFWKKEEDLAESWEYIDSFIALNIQSKIELLIERSNFYICHFVSTVVQKKIKREIEQDPFCAKKYIYDGDIFQVVLSQRLTAETDQKPIDLYRKLRAINPSPYLLYLNFGDYQVAGSSPEMLVEVSGNKVKTCPIAGTRKRGKNLKEDIELAEGLLNDEKEIAEHTMLVDLARNDMGRVSKIGSVKVTELKQIHYYSHVMHIVSLVEGEKREDKDCFDVLSTFLPAGTLSGAPKIRAMEIIEELEEEKRGLYGGSIGYFSFNGNMDMCIAIRTMIIKDKKIYMQAGAGIVADSIPKNEYEESHNKVRALVKTIGGEV